MTRTLYCMVSFFLLTAFLNAQTLLHTEDLETDGEGTRYASNTFDDGANDLWTRWNAGSNNRGPNTNLHAPYNNFQGNFSWCAEDTDGGTAAPGDNPLGFPEDGYFVVQTLDISAWAGQAAEVRIWLAGSTQGGRFEFDDFIAVQAAFDADIANGANTVGAVPSAANVNTGLYANVGAFYGITPSDLIQDTDLDGAAEPASPSLTETLTQYTFTFNVPGGASNMSIRVRCHVNTGSEEAIFDQIEVYGTTVAPVELTNFEGKRIRDRVKLDWSTASETNNSGFEIMMKHESEEDFNPIGFVKGNGTASQTNHYEFSTEPLAKGSYTFMLRQIDLDGSIEESNTIEVFMQNQQEVGLTIYPNPFSDHVEIDFDHQIFEEVDFSLADLTGKVLVSGSAAPDLLGDMLSKSLSNKEAGMYILRVETNSSMIVKPLIKR